MEGIEVVMETPSERAAEKTVRQAIGTNALCAASGSADRRAPFHCVPKRHVSAKEHSFERSRSESAMLNTKLVTWALGIWAAVTFVVCVIYGLVTPQSLHMSAFLEMVLPAFKWLTWWGFLLGLIESFLYGAYAGLVFCPIYNWLYRRWGTD